MPSRVASFGLAGSLRFDVPLMDSAWLLAVTMSVRSTSPTVSAPDVLSPALVSVSAAVSGPSAITGASLVPLMVMVRVAVLYPPTPSLTW